MEESKKEELEELRDNCLVACEVCGAEADVGLVGWSEARDFSKEPQRQDKCVNHDIRALSKDKRGPLIIMQELKWARRRPRNNAAEQDA